MNDLSNKLTTSQKQLVCTNNKRDYTTKIPHTNP